MSKTVDLFTFSTEGFKIVGSKSKERNDKETDYVYEGPLVHQFDDYSINGNVLKIKAKDNNNTTLFETSIENDSSWLDLTRKLYESSREEMSRPSQITENYCFTFGMYYARKDFISVKKAAGLIDSDLDKLPSRHQIYAVITRNQNNWMERLFSALSNDNLNSIPFSTMVLPGSHDAGMYLNDSALLSLWANTQKDNISTQLQLGVRAFDIRPAFNVSNKELFQYHGAIQGEKYSKMIGDILSFLKENTQEIVVIHLCDNGIDTDRDDETDIKFKVGPSEVTYGKRLPTGRYIEEITNTSAQKINLGETDENKKINITGKASLRKPIAELLKNGERLIVVSKDLEVYSDQKLISRSSYSNKANVSTDAKGLSGALDHARDDQNDWKIYKNDDKSYTKDTELMEISLQLTATGASIESGVVNTIENIIHKEINGIPDLSPLIATKGMADHVTYNWLMNNNFSNKPNDVLIAMYNDFVDGGLTEIAAHQSEIRIKSFLDNE